MLKDNVENKKYLDVGLGVERHIGISRTKLKAALSKLEEEGYKIHKFDIEQLGTSKKTKMMVLTKDDVSYGELMKNKDKIRMTTDYTEDGGRTVLGIEPPKSVSSKRVLIRYNEDGGSDKDGVIELRRGVEELSLGNSRYAQVRVAVDDTHYMKGMAVYSDSIPKGYDIIYNTNKSIGTPKEKVFKEMKDDPDNPFGATVRQRHYGNGKLSPLNIVNIEGEWHDKWSKSLSSQMLSKQSTTLAKKQLDMAYNIKKEEFDEIMSLTNPVVKKKLLESFSDDCDSSAVHLKSAAMPRTSWHVLIPFPKMKENEVYAPNYRNGEKVVLIRYPHGGRFEIPELVVNNKHKEAKDVLGTSRDAVGIHPKVAAKLSGADFDGDSVLVIPNNNGLVKTRPSLKALKDFDPKTAYPAYEGMPVMKTRTTALKMGDVSNLITDMTIKGANEDEIAKAVRHSMVVIDAEKHRLNYKQSYIDHGIAALKKKYQGSNKSGASTLISRASSDIRIGTRKEKKPDPLTGEKVWEYTNDKYIRDGKEIKKTIKSTKMYETKDAFALSSGTPMETVYASHANKLKALANTARKESLSTDFIPWSPSAKETYSKEVASMNAKLNVALKNKPLERQAQLLANSIVSAKRNANPNLEASQIKKIKGQALEEARSRTKAKKQNIEITDQEWKAIQAGAISKNTLMQILNNTDLDKIKQLATPRSALELTPNKQAKAKSLLSSGYTQSEVADQLGISTRTLSKMLD
jgi:DNA-binding MarR family transcriptional regulator